MRRRFTFQNLQKDTDEPMGIRAIVDNVNVSASKGAFIYGNLYYRINRGIWSAFDTINIILNKDDTVEFKGALYPLGEYHGNFMRFAISNKVELFGSTSSILKDNILYPMCFESMFSGAPIVSVSKNFLPLNELVEDCYAGMFSGCTSLVDAPELPATTLAKYCYYSMFSGCTSLVAAPELPATTLSEYCYNSMFSGCKSLENAPELPATTLTVSCYESMFRDCTSLVNAPELPANVLETRCYYSMFSGCGKLSYIKMLAIEVLVGGTSLDYWVSRVASAGTFVKNKNARWNITGQHGVPNGWTIQYE